MNGSGRPVLGNTPVATAILVKDWNPTRAAIPVQNSLPAMSLALDAILRHSKTNRRNSSSQRDQKDYGNAADKAQFFADDGKDKVCMLF